MHLKKEVIHTNVDVADANWLTLMFVAKKNESWEFQVRGLGQVAYTSRWWD
jgi:hypothetical protein